MAQQRILVIEDDEAIRTGIVDALGFEGYAVSQAEDGDAGLDSALGVRYDLLLLDLMLPGKTGMEILEAVRAERPTMPVVILTARGGEDDRIRGLKLGADDYVVKPFCVKELLARIEAVLRRSPARPSDLTALALPGGVADFERREVRLDSGTRHELSAREMELLRYLARNAGRALSRDEILTHVWHINPQTIVETRTIDMHIRRLREKLGDDASNPSIILTVRGKGYMLAGGLAPR